MNETLAQMIELLKTVNATPEIWDQFAKSYWNAFEAMVRAGFTEDQALQILSRQGTSFKAST